VFSFIVFHFIFIFLICTFSIYNTFDILSLNNQIFLNKGFNFYILGLNISSSEFLAMLLVGAAFIKSAQFGGHA